MIYWNAIVFLMLLSCARPEVLSDSNDLLDIDPEKLLDQIPDRIIGSSHSFTWDSDDKISYIKLYTSVDTSCSQVRDASELFDGNSGSLSLSTDGDLHLCIDAFDLSKEIIGKSKEGVPVRVKTGIPTAIIENKDVVGSAAPTELSFSIAGDGIEKYRYKFGDSPSTVCSDEAGYTENSLSIDQNIVINVQDSIGDMVILCIVAEDDEGDWQPFTVATEFIWIVSINSELQGVTLATSTNSVAKGKTLTVAAIANYANGFTQDVSAEAYFTSSDTNVFTVDTTKRGSPHISGVNIGSATLGISYDSLTENATLSVTAAEITDIEISPGTTTLANGSGLQFACTGIYSDSSTDTVTSLATWASSNTAIVAVDNSSNKGLATGQSAGEAQVSCSLDGFSQGAGVVVSSATLASIVLTPSNQSVSIGSTVSYLATGVYSNGTTQDVTNSGTWVSSDTGVATISNTSPNIGSASGVGVGSSTIGFSIGAVSESTTLTVTSATLDSIVLSPSSLSLANGSSENLVATGNYSDSTTQSLTASATWVSVNTDVATVGNVSNKGKANANDAGSTTITTTYGGQSVSSAVTVTAATLTSIALSPSAPSLPSGTSLQFYAVATYSDTSTQDISDDVIWSSSDPDIMTISNADSTEGLGTSIAPGSVTIQASLAGVSSATSVTVTSATLSSLSVTPATPSVALGSEVQFLATGLYSDSTTQDLTAAVTWTSNSPGVATIDTSSQKGNATSISSGTTTILATLGGVSDSTTLSVSAATLSSIAVTPSAPTVALGLGQQLVATGTYSDATTQDITNQVSWVSSQPSILSISNTSGTEGFAGSVSVGSATATATLGGVSGSTTITINSATLVSIAVTPSTPSIVKGLTTALVATGTYSDATTATITTSCTWSSNNALVASVSNALGFQGLVTSILVGTSTLQCQFDGKTGSSIITVTLF